MIIFRYIKSRLVICLRNIENVKFCIQIEKNILNTYILMEKKLDMLFKESKVRFSNSSMIFAGFAYSGRLKVREMRKMLRSALYTMRNIFYPQF